MIEQNLNKLEKLINSELSSKISGSEIKFGELLFKTSVSEIPEVIKFLKLDNKFKFNQLIDIAAIDYPNEEKRFELVYLLLSVENNIRVKISIKFETNEKIPSIVKIFPSANWMEREIFDPVKLEQNYRNFDFSSPWEGTKYLKEVKERKKNEEN